MRRIIRKAMVSEAIAFSIAFVSLIGILEMIGRGR